MLTTAVFELVQVNYGGTQRKVCKKWWDGFWTQTITQIPTETLFLHSGPFTMFLEIFMQINSVVFALSRQINKQKVCENN